VALVDQGQDSLAAGMVRDVARHLIPTNACYDAENALLDDDGSAYKRAGGVYKTAAVTGNRVRQLWDGQLAGGLRTFFATDSAFYTLDSDDTTVRSLGGAGGSVQGARWVAFRDVLYGPGGVMWGGSRKTADYSTGTVTVTNGSTAVVGAGTSWLANVDVGMLLRVGGAGPYYVVAAVGSDTTLTLKEAYQGVTAGGAAYALSRLGVAVVPSSNYPAQFSAVGAGAIAFVAVVGNRLIFTDGSSRLWFTAVNNPYSFTSTDFHELPGGVRITGLDRIRDTLIAFTTGGIFSVANLALALTDPSGNAQQRVARLTTDAILWGDPGIVSWGDRLIVPTLRGVILLDANGPAANVSGDPPYGISTLIRRYARAGFKPGGATLYDGHYFLPIVTGDTVIDTLVCRVDRPAGRWRGRAYVTSYPWSRFSGHGANVLVYAARTAATVRPDLLGGSSGAPRLLQLRYTEPTSANKLEADGSRFTFTIESRDHKVQRDENKSTVRKARLRYELTDAGSDAPRIAGFASVGAAATGLALYDAGLYDTAVYAGADVAAYLAMQGSAPPDDGRNPFTFQPGPAPGGGYMPGGMRGRFIRFRWQSSDPAAKLVIREWTFWARPSRKVN
jgi:hypothetical protein